MAYQKLTLLNFKVPVQNSPKVDGNGLYWKDLV